MFFFSAFGGRGKFADGMGGRIDFSGLWGCYVIIFVYSDGDFEIWGWLGIVGLDDDC